MRRVLTKEARKQRAIRSRARAGAALVDHGLALAQVDCAAEDTTFMLVVVHFDVRILFFLSWLTIETISLLYFFKISQHCMSVFRSL